VSAAEEPEKAVPAVSEGGDPWVVEKRAEKLAVRPCNDIGNAWRLVDHYGYRFRHNEAQGWMFWNGQIWKPDDSEAQVSAASQELREIVRQEAVRAHEMGYTSSAKELFKAAARLHSAGPIANAVRLWRPHCFLPATEFDQDPSVVTVANGMLDLDTRERLPYDPSMYCTRRMPVRYDPAARAPFYEKTLETFVPDEAVRAYLQRLAGYCLTPLTGEQMFGIFIGPGSNGKSTILEAWRQVLGRSGDRGFSVEANPRTFETRTTGSGAGPDPERVGLLGARLVTPVETNTQLELDAAFVKSITGGESIVARDLYRTTLTFKPSFKLIFASNHQPKINDDSSGMWRRPHVVQFEVTMPEEKKLNFDEVVLRLEAERPGILNWMLEGYEQWKITGLDPPPQVLLATAEMRLAQDRYGLFLSEMGTLDPGNPALTAGRAELWAAFNHWRNKDESMRRVGRNEFYEVMRNRLGAEDGYRRFHGINLSFPFSSETLY
jgi:putative DNA primase/helicase